MCWLDHSRVSTRSKRTYRHIHARTYTPCLFCKSPKPRRCPVLPGRALRRKRSPPLRLLGSFNPSLLHVSRYGPPLPLFSRSRFVKAESHRSTEEEEEVEGGRGLLFMQIQAVFRVSWTGRGEGSRHFGRT